MSLQAFSFPFPETRFIRAGRFIYKFKIRAGNSYRQDNRSSGEEMMAENISQELEDIMRTVLGNLDHLQPFSSAHFNVFPYKKQWEGATKVMCKHSEKTLRAFPFMLVLYVERNAGNEKQAEKTLSQNKEIWRSYRVSELQSKRSTGNSPPDGNTLKDLSEDIEAVGIVSVRHGFSHTASSLSVDSPQAEGLAQEVVDMLEAEMLSSSQLKSGCSTVTGSGGQDEVQPEKTKDIEEEQQPGEDGEKTDGGPETCDTSGILTRLASAVVSFSRFFKDS